MKKIIVLLFVVAILGVAAAEVQAAGASFTGPTMVGTALGSTLSVQPSNNVYVFYNGAQQTYGAASKNKAGDKQFATGGGQGSSSGLYYKISDICVGSVLVNCLDDPGFSFVFAAGTGWTAQ
jgi:hypothetical protein